MERGPSGGHFLCYNPTAKSRRWTRASLHRRHPRRPRETRLCPSTRSLVLRAGQADTRWCEGDRAGASPARYHNPRVVGSSPTAAIDRKSTRLNSSHGYISYAVFCLKKKKKKKK